MSDTQADPAEVLRTVDLAAGYNGVPVVHNVNLIVPAGKLVALLGPNGAGKSTTMLAIAGQIPALHGRIEFNGTAVRGAAYKRARKGLSFIGEDRNVFRTLTTYDNLRLRDPRVDDALDLIPELRPLLHRRAGLLSGGEQQFLALARALATKPRLLMIDEVSLGLAPLIVARLLDALQASAARGIGVLIVEQYARRALDVADYVYVMRRGKVELAGTSAEIREGARELEGVYLSTRDVR